MTSLLPILLAPSQGSPSWFFPVQIALMVGIFWFLLIRPQSQARKKHAAILAQLKKGDDITTAGGIIGKVKDVKDDAASADAADHPDDSRVDRASAERRHRESTEIKRRDA